MKLLAFIATALLFLCPERGGAIFQEVQNNASWIRECQGDRLYIKADRLEIKDNGIFVKDEQNVLYSLTHIFVDPFGIYTTIQSMSDIELSTVWNLVWCRHCNAYRSVNIRGLCVICGNPP